MAAINLITVQIIPSDLHSILLKHVRFYQADEAERNLLRLTTRDLLGSKTKT